MIAASRCFPLQFWNIWNEEIVWKLYVLKFYFVFILNERPTSVSFFIFAFSKKKKKKMEFNV